MTTDEIREKYLKFFEERGHKRISAAPLVLENDPTTLFTSSGMQPLVPYLKGEPHPEGKRLVNSQPCFRSQEIEEVGDNRHTTFFEMLGNWSLGAYFKEDQLSWIWQFLTDKQEGLGLNPERLYISVFGGEEDFKVLSNDKYQPLSPDVESVDIWQKLLEESGVDSRIANLASKDKPDIKEGRIFYYGASKNWWSLSGIPNRMSVGDIGGPDSEIFYDFGEELKYHEISPWKSEPCHPNCNCGRFLEIGNSVFIQYRKIDEVTLEELPQKNVDFGGGLERLAAAVNNTPDIFQIDIFRKLYDHILSAINLEVNNTRKARVRKFLDHSRAAMFLIAYGVKPGKNKQEYELRTLIRNANDQLTILQNDISHTKSMQWWEEAVKHYGSVYEGVYKFKEDTDTIKIIKDELAQYGEVFSTGNLGKIEEQITPNVYRSENILQGNLQKYLKVEDTPSFMSQHRFVSLPSVAAGTVAFEARSTLGVPIEGQGGTLEITRQRLGSVFRENEFMGTIDVFSKVHQGLSRTQSVGMFRGGLADHSEQVVKLHTATHLLHAALRKVLGEHVSQKGSNITAERLRFDFSHPTKLTEEEIKKIEDMVNEQVKKNLPVCFEEMTMEEAKEKGALAFFGERYGDKVKVYTIGSQDSPFSREVCGGPHVKNTKEIGRVKITKEESAGAGIRRVYATIH